MFRTNVSNCGIKGNEVFLHAKALSLFTCDVRGPGSLLSAEPFGYNSKMPGLDANPRIAAAGKSRLFLLVLEALLAVVGLTGLLCAALLSEASAAFLQRVVPSLLPARAYLCVPSLIWFLWMFRPSASQFVIAALTVFSAFVAVMSSIVVTILFINAVLDSMQSIIPLLSSVWSTASSRNPLVASPCFLATFVVLVASAAAFVVCARRIPMCCFPRMPRQLVDDAGVGRTLTTLIPGLRAEAPYQTGLLATGPTSNDVVQRLEASIEFLTRQVRVAEAATASRLSAFQDEIHALLEESSPKTPILAAAYTLIDACFCAETLAQNMDIHTELFHPLELKDEDFMHPNQFAVIGAVAGMNDDTADPSTKRPPWSNVSLPTPDEMPPLFPLAEDERTAELNRRAGILIDRALQRLPLTEKELTEAKKYRLARRERAAWNAPFRTRYLTDEEKQVGRLQPALLGQIWRFVQYWRDGRQPEESVVDSWPLPPLTEEQLQLPRMEVRRIIAHLRDVHPRELRAQRGEDPGQRCATCLRWVGPNHSCARLSERPIEGSAKIRATVATQNRRGDVTVRQAIAEDPIRLQEQLSAIQERLRQQQAELELVTRGVTPVKPTNVPPPPPPPEQAQNQHYAPAQPPQPPLPPLLLPEIQQQRPQQQPTALPLTQGSGSPISTTSDYSWTQGQFRQNSGLTDDAPLGNAAMIATIVAETVGRLIGNHGGRKSPGDAKPPPSGRRRPPPQYRSAATGSNAVPVGHSPNDGAVVPQVTVTAPAP